MLSAIWPIDLAYVQYIRSNFDYMWTIWSHSFGVWLEKCFDCPVDQTSHQFKYGWYTMVAFLALQHRPVLETIFCGRADAQSVRPLSAELVDLALNRGRAWESAGGGHAVSDMFSRAFKQTKRNIHFKAIWAQPLLTTSRPIPACLVAALRSQRQIARLPATSRIFTGSGRQPRHAGMWLLNPIVYFSPIKEGERLSNFASRMPSTTSLSWHPYLSGWLWPPNWSCPQ